MIEWRDYEKTVTIELIELIKMKGDPKHLETAKAAFHAFYFRFLKSVAKKAEIVSKNNGHDREFAVEITEKTFEKFWKYPAFKLEKMNASTPEKGVELYLSRIAQNCFYDLINKKNGINVSPYNGHEEIVYEVPTPNEFVNISNERFQILNKVLSTFSWKHRIIYLTYLQHEVNGHKLPRKLLIELRKKLDVTQDTIRFYRHEVLTKISEYTEIWRKN